MRSRLLATAIGSFVAVAGLVLVVVPGLAAGMGVGRFFLYGIAVLAALLLMFDIRTLLAVERDCATPPEVEAGVSHPRAGAAVDALLADVAAGYDRHTRARRDRLEARIRTVAVDVLARRADSSPDAVEAMLVEGSWTDDPYAAAFLGAHDVGDLPWRERVLDALRPEARYVRRATHAIHAIADLETGDHETEEANPDRETGDHETGDHGTGDRATADRTPPKREVDAR